MDTVDVIILLTIVALVVLSCLFSATEVAYSTASKSKLTNLENEGNAKAGKVLKLLEKEEKVASTVLVGNTIANITIATLGVILFAHLLKSESIGALISAIAITVVVLLFGEIAPKTLAKHSPERFAMNIYGFLMIFYFILTPLTVIFSGWRWLICKMFGIKKVTTFSEDELITIVEAAESEGEIEKHESELIRSAIEFEDVDVKAVMVPRVNVVAISGEQPLEEIYEVFRESGFSRLPVYDQSIDSVVGIIHEKDFSALLHDNQRDISAIIQKCIYVAPTLKISTVLSMLQKAKVHMAIVVDEFGGTEGIVTLEDIIEELVGEIYDEHDEEEQIFTEVADNTYVVSGGENFAELMEKLEVVITEETEATTIGGFVTEQLDRIPVPGDTVTVGRLEIEVMSATAKMVEEVRVTVTPKEEEKE